MKIIWITICWLMCKEITCSSRIWACGYEKRHEYWKKKKCLRLCPAWSWGINFPAARILAPFPPSPISWHFTQCYGKVTQVRPHWNWALATHSFTDLWTTCKKQLLNWFEYFQSCFLYGECQCLQQGGNHTLHAR